MGVPLSETFLREHRESISCCFIEAGRAGVRLPAGVQLPPLQMATGDNQMATGDHHLATGDNGDVPDFAPPPNGDTVLSREDRSAPDPSANGAVPADGTIVPRPTTIPTDSVLPCAGQCIADLKPAALAMLISKTAQLVRVQGVRWVPLLHALQAERAGRLDRGRKKPLAPEANGDGA
jgi:hypothetical protein